MRLVGISIASFSSGIFVRAILMVITDTSFRPGRVDIPAAFNYLLTGIDCRAFYQV